MSYLGYPCYRPLGWMNWAPVLGLCQELGRFTGPAYKASFNPASWAWEVGPRAYFLNPISTLNGNGEGSILHPPSIWDV